LGVCALLIPEMHPMAKTEPIERILYLVERLAEAHQNVNKQMS
jgi:hypothetical protein